MIPATSFFHPGPDTLFIELHKLRQYIVLSMLLPNFFKISFFKLNSLEDFNNYHMISSLVKLEIVIFLIKKKLQVDFARALKIPLQNKVF